MKTMLEVCMYSGGCQWDPRCEITPEQDKILMEKINKLHKKAEATRFGTGCLGADSFAVVWGVTEIKNDGFTFVELYEEFLKGLRVTGLHAYPGRIRVTTQTNGTYQMDMYEDTEDIHEFLAELAKPAIQAHYDRANQQIQEYWDKMGAKE